LTLKTLQLLLKIICGFKAIYKIDKVDLLFKQHKDEDAIDLLLKTKYDPLERLIYIKNTKQFDYIIKSEHFEDEYFRRIMKDTTDKKERYKYRKIYAHSLLLINFLLVSGEKVAHYTTKSVAQKLLFDENSKFRLNMATLSNDLKEGKTLCDYLASDDPQYFWKKVFKYQREELRAFIGCFSFNKNCLNQFRLYGKEGEKEGSGVSLLFSDLFFPNKSKTATSSANIFPLYRCMYIDSETGRVVSVGHKEDETCMKKIKKIVSDVQRELKILKQITQGADIDKSIVFKLLINLRYLTKDAAFKEEQECRIVRILPYKDKQVKISEDYNKMYIECPKEEDEKAKISKDYIEYLFRDYIKEITFGPTATGIDLFQDILQKKGLKNVKCTQSKLPLA
jgi:hypothetical protein